jgi:hypothetical protein
MLTKNRRAIVAPNGKELMLSVKRIDPSGLPPKSMVTEPALPLLIKSDKLQEQARRPPMPNKRPLSGIRKHLQMKS